MSTTNILRQYSTSYNLPLSSVPTSNTISLPFTYYRNSPIKIFEYDNKKIRESYVNKTTNFDKISAWLDHTEIMTQEEQEDNDILFIDEIQQQSISSSPIEIDHKCKKKKTHFNIRFFCHLNDVLYIMLSLAILFFFLLSLECSTRFNTEN